MRKGCRLESRNRIVACPDLYAAIFTQPTISHPCLGQNRCDRRVASIHNVTDMKGVGKLEGNCD